MRVLWQARRDNKDGVASSPDISPDGSRIIYAAYRNRAFLPWNENYLSKIIVSDPDGSNEKTLIESGGMNLSPAWSPDGSAIAFVSSPIQSSIKDRALVQNFTMAPDGSEIKSLTPSVSADLISPPVWSPDGQSLAFTVDSVYGSGALGPLYTVGADGSGLSQLGRTLSLPAWSPDGGRIAWIGVETPEKLAVYISNLEDSSISRLLDGDDQFIKQFTELSWSPDGTQLLLSGIHMVALVDADGTNPRVLTSLRVKGPGLRATFSPDGSRIAVYVPALEKNLAGRFHGGLFTMRPDGEDKRILASHTFQPYEDTTGALQESYATPWPSWLQFEPGVQETPRQSVPLETGLPQRHTKEPTLRQPTFRLV